MAGSFPSRLPPALVMEVPSTEVQERSLSGGCERIMDTPGDLKGYAMGIYTGAFMRYEYISRTNNITILNEFKILFSNLSTHNRRDDHRSSMKFCKLDVGCSNILLWIAGIHIYLKWRSRMKQLAVHLLQVDTTSDHLIFVGFIMFSHVFLSSARCCGYPFHLA